MELTCQEIEVWYILPAIRKEFAKVLIEKKGFNQKMAADLLGVTKAAVSQWLSKKRANEKIINLAARKRIEESIDRILDDKGSLAREISRTCDFITESRITCRVHKSHSRKMKNCEMCDG